MSYLFSILQISIAIASLTASIWWWFVAPAGFFFVGLIVLWLATSWSVGTIHNLQEKRREA